MADLSSFWLHRSSDAVILEGYDAGVSFRSVHDPRSNVTRTVISNSSDGAWPVARRLDELLTGPQVRDGGEVVDEAGE